MNKSEAKKQPAALAPGLHIVATPIGNLGDITLRALDALRAADLILCEDTRVTTRLLGRYGIQAKLAPYHDHNADRVRPGIVKRLLAGERIALVSDAGTPMIADPGYKLVNAAVEAGVAVRALPGPSAALAALSISGLPTDRFLFAGFAPARGPARRRWLEGLSRIGATLVYFESPRRLAASLADAATTLGDRPAAIAREMTKIHEEARRGDLAALAAHYANAGAPKGEVVVVVGPPREAANETDPKRLDAALKAELDGRSLKEAVARVAAAQGLPRRAVYARALEISGRNR